MVTFLLIFFIYSPPYCDTILIYRNLLKYGRKAQRKKFGLNTTLPFHAKLLRITLIYTLTERQRLSNNNTKEKGIKKRRRQRRKLKKKRKKRKGVEGKEQWVAIATIGPVTKWGNLSLLTSFFYFLIMTGSQSHRKFLTTFQAKTCVTT